jgi:predicted ATPase/DNA-binding SARP family transcriptional activator
VRVGILGPLQVEAGGSVVPVGGARVRTLLVRLALEPGRTVTLEAITAALWPDRAPAQPVNAVQTLVSRLRKALPDGDVVRSVPGGYRLELAPESVDAVEFERLAEAGRQALGRGDSHAAAVQLAEALALWRGEALAGSADAPYLAAEASRLAELRLAAIEDRVAAQLRSGQPGSLVAELRQLATAHPLRERVRALLVRALHAAGRPAEALATYEQFRRQLADELGADPGPELRRAHLAVLREEPDATPEPAAAGTAGNLRADLTSFVGRDEERREVAALLRQRRLVTLVGPGGAGKTRLATTVAADLAGSFTGGAWLVELALVSGAGEVAPAVLAAMGIRTGRGASPGAVPRDPAARLVDALAGTEAVLVLDNCEHLLDAAAHLTGELLRRCPRLRVLATSREPLGIGGETLCPVLPLGLPEPGAPAGQAVASAAVRLFADRAAAVRPGFAVTGDNVGAVVEICRRLDGLPLAIELAAARLRSLPLGRLATGLDDRFRLLGAGERGAEPRHRTLRAVVSWSWELLAPAERLVAAQLAVFPGCITPEAAGQVTGAGVDMLAGLVDRSLLHLYDGPEPTYRMLETIRDYGREQLAVAGELDRVRAAHAAYYVDLAERAAPHLRGAGQLAWLARLTADRGSPAAYGYAREAGDAGTLVRLSAALGYFWTIMGDHARVAQRLRVALTVPGPSPPAARAEASAMYLFNSILAGGDPAAAVRLCRADGAWMGVAPHAAMIEAMLALVEHDVEAGLAATGELVAGPDPWARGMGWLLRSWLHGNDGAVPALRRAQDAAVAAFRSAGERWGLATGLTHLAHVQVTLGEFDGAIAGLDEAVRLLRELDPSDPAVQPRVLLAAARVQRGDRVRARAELLELVAPGSAPAPASSLLLARIALGDLARLDGEVAEAARQYGAAGEELARVPYDASVLRAMLSCARGHLAAATGEFEAAGWLLAEAFALAVEAADLAVAADVTVAVARLRLSGGAADAADAAARLLGAAHALRGSPDEYDADVVELAGKLAAHQGERAYRTAYERGRGLDLAGVLALVRAQVPGS